ncbi:hypothetical protein ACOME3_006521 [Neoechinorhynchus agilis]
MSDGPPRSKNDIIWSPENKDHVKRRLTKLGLLSTSPMTQSPQPYFNNIDQYKNHHREDYEQRKQKPIYRPKRRPNKQKWKRKSYAKSVSSYGQIESVKRLLSQGGVFLIRSSHKPSFRHD